MEKPTVKTDPYYRDPVRWVMTKSPEFKLKDKFNRDYVVIDLIDFGFIPEKIVIRKVKGESNKLFVLAVMPPDLAKKQKKKDGKDVLPDTKKE